MLHVQPVYVQPVSRLRVSVLFGVTPAGCIDLSSLLLLLQDLRRPRMLSFANRVMR